MVPGPRGKQLTLSLLSRWIRRMTMRSWHLFDLEMAFDQLLLSEMWKGLKNPEYFVELTLVIAMMCLHRNCISAVRAQVNEDNLFDVIRGLRQGRKNSPLLYMDKYSKKNRQRNEVITLAYAEAITIIAHSSVYCKNH